MQTLDYLCTLNFGSDSSFRLAECHFAKNLTPDGFSIRKNITQ